VTTMGGRGFVLDTGALIALEKPASARFLGAVLHRLTSEDPLVVSAGSIAEVWHGTSRQTPLVFLLRRPGILIEEITVPVAKAIGAFLGQQRDGDDIVDAHVVMLAHRYQLPVITTDPGDLRALDPKLPLIKL
jgi:predicted nucleic acid-binding protein